MSTYPPSPVLYPPTQDERTFALLAHVLGIFSGFIAPLIFFLVKRDSKFVSFHALQSLAWHILYFICIFGTILVFIVSMISSGAFHDKTQGPPLAFFGFFGIFWLVAMGGGILNIILGIVFGVKAHKGEWAEFPLLGGWILRKIIFS